MCRFILLVAVTAVCLPSVDPADPPPPEKKNAGFGGFGFPKTDLITLLQNPSVKKELGVTDEQLSKLPDAIKKALAEVLDEKQLKRLRQIDLQRRGNAAFSDDQVRKDLKISAEQIKGIDRILEDTRGQVQDLFREARDSGGGFQTLTPKIAEANEAARDKLMGVLTSEQRKVWKEMIGVEFKVELPFGAPKKKDD